MTTNNQHPNELLAWYVNGTLTGSELQQVESHLPSCTLCQREVELLRTVQQQLREEEVAGPGDFALKRLMKDIKKDESANGGRKWWELWMAAAAILVITVQSIVIIDNPGTGSGTVNMLGGTTSDINIRFTKAARMEDINKLLKSLNTRIISGPDEENFYKLDVRNATLIKNPEKIQAVIKAISKHKKLHNYIDTE